MKLAQVDPATMYQNGHINGHVNHDNDFDALKANRMLHTLGDEEILMVLDAGHWVIFEPEETVCGRPLP